MKISFTLTPQQATRQRVKVRNFEPKGLFLWIGSHNTVDRIVGYHKKHGFIADYCYATGNHWLKDLWINLWDKEGFIRVIRYI